MTEREIYVEHTGLVVRDLQVAVRFFKETFGAKVVFSSERPADGGTFMSTNFAVADGLGFEFVMLQVTNNLCLELFQWSGEGVEKAGIPLSAVGASHVCFHIPNIDEFDALLVARPEITRLGEVKTVSSGPVEGSRWCYYSTSFGLYLELVQRAAELLPKIVTDPAAQVQSDEQQVGFSDQEAVTPPR